MRAVVYRATAETLGYELLGEGAATACSQMKDAASTSCVTTLWPRLLC